MTEQSDTHLAEQRKHSTDRRKTFEVDSGRDVPFRVFRIVVFMMFCDIWKWPDSRRRALRDRRDAYTRPNFSMVTCVRCNTAITKNTVFRRLGETYSLKDMEKVTMILRSDNDAGNKKDWGPRTADLT
jgi:hypothetical protein